MLVGNREWTVEDVVEIAQNKNTDLEVASEEWRATINKGAEFLERHWKEEGTIYGVTTGYGESCSVNIPRGLVEELPTHLTRFHGCGLGRYLDEEAGRAVLAVRLSSLARGKSGVRIEVLEHIMMLLNRNIIPVIPEEGSVGASGDLTPLSYVAAVLIGERQVYYKGAIRETSEVYELEGIPALKLHPKEGLALMNGTSVMTALACLAYSRAEYLSRLASRVTALCVEVLKGNRRHFEERLFAVKPYPGQAEVARRIYSDLEHDAREEIPNRLQDRYSIRCAPHVIGVLEDALPWMKNHIEIELNSANDNPIIDADAEEILHGGHFYGGHMAFAMDSMKNAVANVADLLDRQMALICDKTTNNGLPANLSASTGERAPINHGFKAVQIGVSAWTAEALKQTMPASVFSRSTECHNQDKVSMGTIASRDCLRVLDLTEQVAAAVLLASSQGVMIRQRREEYQSLHLSKALDEMLDSVGKVFVLLEEDRPLEGCLREVCELIKRQDWKLY